MSLAPETRLWALTGMFGANTGMFGAQTGSLQFLFCRLA